MLAINIAGIDKSSAIFIESLLLKPAIKADDMTIPDLDTPGTNAKVCIKPMKTMIPKEQLIKFLSSFLLKSAKYSTKAKNIVITAIVSIFLMCKDM